MDKYRAAQERLMRASFQFGQAQAAMEEAEAEFNAAMAEIEALEGQPLPTAADVRGILVSR